MNLARAMPGNRCDFVCKFLLALISALIHCTGVIAAPVPIDETEIPEYDYSQTQLMVIYGHDDYVLMGNPFEYPLAYGGLVYRIILRYAVQLQPLSGLPDQPVYVLDLFMKNRNYRYRLGQRLYIGDSWLSDGKSLTPMKPEDYQQLAKLLNARYNAGGHVDIKGSEKLRRPREDEHPESWLPEKDSVRVAIERMAEAGVEYPAADPVIQSTQELDGEHEYVDVNDGPVTTAVVSDDPHTAKPVAKVPSSVVTITNVAAETPTIVTEVTSDNDNVKRQRWFLYIVLALIGLFLLRQVVIVIRRSRHDI